MRGEIFREIALALSGRRGSGRTTRMIDHAPQKAVILCATAGQALELQSVAKERNRGDLTTLTMSEAGRTRGIIGPFVADHLSIERWLFNAAQTIDDQEREIAVLKEKLAAARQHAHALLSTT
jgi:hypothetical protein